MILVAPCKAAKPLGLPTGFYDTYSVAISEETQKVQNLK